MYVYWGEDRCHPPQPSCPDIACPMAICSHEGFRRITHNEMAMLPPALELAFSGERKGLCGWLQPLVGGRDGSDKGCEGLGRNFGGQSCSDKARYQEIEQGH